MIRNKAKSTTIDNRETRSNCEAGEQRRKWKARSPIIPLDVVRFIQQVVFKGLNDNLLALYASLFHYQYYYAISRFQILTNHSIQNHHNKS